ncbi:MAG: FAD-binding oxidoreductase [Candidatus Micrarchaeota archaeon]|nr:FAD-binding oxidoreductase [Candidatus Micrarchaeota archaeon]
MQSNPLWPARDRFPKLEGKSAADIVVIGAGIAGMSCAYHLSSAGYDVAVLEMDELGSGATGASSGVLYYGSGTNFVPAIGLFGRERAALLWKETAEVIEDIARTIAEHGISCGLTREGAIMAAKTDGEMELIRREHAALEEIGIKTTVLTAAQVAEYYSPSGFLGGLAFGTCGQIHPGLFIQGLARSAGIRLYENSEVTGYRREGGKIVVSTKAGSVSCSKAIYATNAQPCFGMERHFRLESSVIIAGEPVADIGRVWPKKTIIWTMEERYDLIYPQEGRLVLELYRLEGREQKLRHYYPGVEFRIDKTWGKAWAKTSDFMPIVGEVERDVYVAIGMGDQGIIMGWLAGRKLAGLMGGKEPDWFLDLASPKRFGHVRT